ncbi:hypothetical protein [Halomonas sp. C05BenzN]|uniref:hypothetical protein n=1 Tax=Halomonas sp. C05BenzN TaxID=3411041 RepID=UPI003B9503AF
MTHDKQIRIPGTGRRLAAAASIVALSMGTLALAGCGNDDEMPPMEQDAPMEEPAQDSGMGQDEPMEGGASEAPTGGQDTAQEPMEEEPVEEDPMGSDEPTFGDDEEEEQGS